MATSEPSQRVSPASTGPPLIIVITGPSGVGKDALLDELKRRGIPAHITVTATTRPKREVRPEDHRYLSFLSEREFDELLSRDGLLEHAEVYGYHYGVPKQQVADALSAGRDVIIRVDVQGATTIKRIVPDAVTIFLAPSSLDVLDMRLRARGLDGEESIRKRLDAARNELALRDTFDHVIVNEEERLAETAVKVLEVIERERSRPGRATIHL